MTAKRNVLFLYSVFLLNLEIYKVSVALFLFKTLYHYITVTVLSCYLYKPDALQC